MNENIKLFKDLYDEWFVSKKYWFDKDVEYDKYITEKYFTKINYQVDIQEYINKEDYTIQIGAILAYDQIPRHFNRIQKIDVNKYSVIAADISLSLMNYLSKNIELYKSIKAYEWCFILLPHRHIYDKQRIKNIIQFLIEKYNNNETSIEDKLIFKKFLFNTINKIYKKNTTDCLVEQKKLKGENIYQEQYDWNIFKNVLDFCPQEKMKQIDEFQSICFKMFKYEINNIGNDNIIVSLSGGVDSCVGLFLVKNICPNNEIIAVHINYDNKDDCDEELEFVKKYCEVLGVKLYFRTITEIHRCDCHMTGLRSLYEDVTKNIRFDMYKQVESLFENNKTTHVLLGHNKDDCFENIITNISLKCNYYNLTGISKNATISSINFWRPLIDVKKCDIIDFAQKINIPYLNNSTPSWSSRGKIRNVVLPSLESINPDIFNSFFVLKDYIQSSDEIIKKYVVSNLEEKFINYNQDVIQAVLDKKDFICNLNIWIKLFETKKFNDLFGQRLSMKSIQNFIDFITRFNNHFDDIQLNTKHKIILKSDITCLLFKQKNDKILIIFAKT